MVSCGPCPIGATGIAGGPGPTGPSGISWFDENPGIIVCGEEKEVVMATDFESFLRKHPSISSRDVKELKYYIALSDRLQAAAKRKCGVVPEDIGFELAKEVIDHQLENIKEDLRRLPDRLFEEEERIRITKINARDIFYGELLALLVSMIFVTTLTSYLISPEIFGRTGATLIWIFGVATVITIGAAIARRKGYLLM